jgi:hypothetical protein
MNWSATMGNEKFRLWISGYYRVKTHETFFACNQIWTDENTKNSWIHWCLTAVPSVRHHHRKSLSFFMPILILSTIEDRFPSAFTSHTHDLRFHILKESEEDHTENRETVRRALALQKISCFLNASGHKNHRPFTTAKGSFTTSIAQSTACAVPQGFFLASGMGTSFGKRIHFLVHIFHLDAAIESGLEISLNSAAKDFLIMNTILLNPERIAS